MILFKLGRFYTNWDEICINKGKQGLIIPLLCSLKRATRNVRGQAPYPRKEGTLQLSKVDRAMLLTSTKYSNKIVRSLSVESCEQNAWAHSHQGSIQWKTHVRGRPVAP